MNAVIHLQAYRDRRSPPTLVLVDLHEEQIGVGARLALDDTVPMLAKCRSLLTRARSAGWPVAFVRPMRISAAGREPLSPKWIHGFEPQRSDMVFDRRSPSCYANSEFGDAISQGGGTFALAGFSGGGACLSTLMDAFLNGHHATFVSDASLSEPLEGFEPRESHRAVVALARRYADIATAAQWIESISRFSQQHRCPHAFA
jgi:nicotinamidase-related amidase